MRWNAGFARGTDEGVRPYTCAWLRLCWTAEGGRLLRSIRYATAYYSVFCSEIREKSKSPPFDFAQGRLCRKMRDKDGAPSGLLSAQDLFLADSFRYARTSSA